MSFGLSPLGTTSFALSPSVFGGGGITYNQTITGSLSASGIVIKASFVRRVGSLSPAGSLNKFTTRSFSSSISLSGIRSDNSSLAQTTTGAITAFGTVSSRVTYTRAYSSVLTASGGLVKAISKTLTGSLTLSGAAMKQMYLRLAGSLSALGSVSPFKFTPLPPGEIFGNALTFIRRYLGRR